MMSDGSRNKSKQSWAVRKIFEFTNYYLKICTLAAPSTLITFYELLFHFWPIVLGLGRIINIIYVWHLSTMTGGFSLSFLNMKYCVHHKWPFYCTPLKPTFIINDPSTKPRWLQFTVDVLNLECKLLEFNNASLTYKANALQGNPAALTPQQYMVLRCYYLHTVFAFISVHAFYFLFGLLLE